MSKKTENYPSRKTYTSILFSALIIGVLLLSACQPMKLPSTGTSSTPSATSAPAGGSQAKTQAIKVIDSSFDPKQVSVPVGTTVIWTNTGQMTHTVTSDTNAFDSGDLNPGSTFKFTFTQAGTFPYHCKFHGGPNGVGMSGVITVTQ